MFDNGCTVVTCAELWIYHHNTINIQQIWFPYYSGFIIKNVKMQVLISLRNAPDKFQLEFFSKFREQMKQIKNILCGGLHSCVIHSIQ